MIFILKNIIYLKYIFLFILIQLQSIKYNPAMLGITLPNCPILTIQQKEHQYRKLQHILYKGQYLKQVFCLRYTLLHWRAL